jgi:hypothetical protein
MQPRATELLTSVRGETTPHQIAATRFVASNPESNAAVSTTRADTKKPPPSRLNSPMGEQRLYQIRKRALAKALERTGPRSPRPRASHARLSEPERDARCRRTRGRGGSARGRPGRDRAPYFVCFARPLLFRIAPRPRAALPLAPAERLPVSFEKASMTLPAILSTVPRPYHAAEPRGGCRQYGLSVLRVVLVDSPARSVLVDRAVCRASAAGVQQEQADHEPDHTDNHEDYARRLDRKPSYGRIDRKCEDRTQGDQEYRRADRHTV